MRYTEQAGAALDAYVARVRRSLADRSELDPDEVVSGIREHVEASLSLEGVEPATAEDVLEVLDRLGPAESLADDDRVGAAASMSSGASQATSSASFVAWGAVALGVAGVAMLPTRVMPIGLALIAAALVVSRVVVGERAVAATPAGRLATLFWQIGAAVIVFALLLAPAVLVWGWSQTGGPLESSLARYVGVSGSARPGRYWLAMALLAAGVTGVWWIVIGAVVRSVRTTLRRALGPASGQIPDRGARMLAIAGAVLLLAALIGGWLS